MSRRLSQNLNSDYIKAMNLLGNKNRKHKIVAYVEGYDDVLFWSSLLNIVATDKYYFEVMLPSHNTLSKGKKEAIANVLGEQLGDYMIACVDADYDYLLQGKTLISASVCQSPYIFHTYVYAIENFQCYAPALHNVCVMTTLNDHRIFDFQAFMAQFSRIMHPLFVWSIWCYRNNRQKQFSLPDFYHAIELCCIDYLHPEKTLDRMRKHVNIKMAHLQHMFPEGRRSYKPLQCELKKLGVSPERAYLYMRGHDLFDGIVAPMLEGVCESLRKERKREIRELAIHETQQQNELASYEHSSASVEEMLRKHNGFVSCKEYQQILQDIKTFLHNISSTTDKLPKRQSSPSSPANP